MQNKNPLSLYLLVLIFVAISASCQTAITGAAIIIKDSAVFKIKKTAVNIIFDTVLYNKKLKEISNGDTKGLWPQKFSYPLSGGVFPNNRIVAFYGNLYSKKMGILGQIPKDLMFAKLKIEVNKWKVADTTTPVIPALHYIAVTAQGLPGNDGKYRQRMPFRQIDTIVDWASQINALVFLDIQVGLSNVKAETLLLERYLKMPGVHLGIDPEFSLKDGEAPGSKIGTFTADDINDAIDILADIVTKNNLPPKILIVHRFTQGMITDYKRIKRVPEVQVVMNMDGWGQKVLKISTYHLYIYKEPVEFTGFKLFYKNDVRKDKNGLFTPIELLKLKPRPVYIQYQ